MSINTMARVLLRRSAAFTSAFPTKPPACSKLSVTSLTSTSRVSSFAEPSRSLFCSSTNASKFLSFADLSRSLFCSSANPSKVSSFAEQARSLCCSSANARRVSSFAWPSRSLLCSSAKLSALPTRLTYPATYLSSGKGFSFEQKQPHCLPLVQGVRGLSTNPKKIYENICEDIKQIHKAPYPALVLGFSGLAPFIFPPIYMLQAGVFATSVAFAQVAYAATILSFLGGVRWGYVIPEDSNYKPDWMNLGYSVLPALVGWSALLMPISLGQLTLMGGLAAAGYFDTVLNSSYPPWFKGMRTLLSVGAVASLIPVFFFGLILESSDAKKKCAEMDKK